MKEEMTEIETSEDQKQKRIISKMLSAHSC